jgi:hypothetical protein
MTPQAGWPQRFVLVQVPNAPLIVALAASVVHRLAYGWAATYASALFYVALGIWAYGEAAQGVNWFRRLLGVGFLIYIVVRLARALHG